jgi:hypothetical protein
MLLTVDDIPDLRQMILICRRYRQEATRKKREQEEAEYAGYVRSSRARYQRALRHLRCAH